MLLPDEDHEGLWRYESPGPPLTVAIRSHYDQAVWVHVSRDERRLGFIVNELRCQR